MADIIENQGTQGTESAGSEKTFTQAEVDAIIGKRLVEERKKYPTADELTAFQTWKASQQTETEKLASIIAERDRANTERDAAKAQAEQLQNERYLLSKGVAADDLDYYSFKIGKQVSDNKTFAQAADEFLKDKEPNPKIRIDTGANIGGGSGGKNPHEAFNSLLRRAAKY